LSLTPGEMAARLIHCELERHFTQRERRAKRRAAQTQTPAWRDFHDERARRAAAARSELPTWRTLWRKLRQRPSSKPSTSSSE
jgi:hypothetical protein